MTSFLWPALGKALRFAGTLQVTDLRNVSGFLSYSLTSSCLHHIPQRSLKTSPTYYEESPEGAGHGGTGPNAIPWEAEADRSQYVFEAVLGYVASSQSSQGYTVKPCPQSVILLERLPSPPEFGLATLA